MNVSLDDMPAPIDVPPANDQPTPPTKWIPLAKEPAALIGLKPATNLSKSRNTPEGATNTLLSYLPQKPVKHTEPHRYTTIIKEEVPTLCGIIEETKIELSSEEKKALALGPVVPKCPPLGGKYKNEKVSFHGAF